MSKSMLRTDAGRPAGPVGYGLLGLTIPWAKVEYPVAVKLMKTALEHGANIWNGSTHYGTPEANSLHLIKYYFEQYPQDAAKVVLTMKGAFTLQNGPDGSPEGIRTSVEDAIRILPPSIKTIDTFQCGRVDPKVPIETTIKALAELAKEGKIRGIGLSEASAQTIRRAHAVHPISVVEIEMSLFTPDPLHNGIVDACNELGITIMAYSPISRGWLSGKLRSMDDLPGNDFRRNLPRFQPENFDQNLKLVDAVAEIARRKGVTTAQVALGWVCHHGAIPIPGSTNEARIIENCQPALLTSEDSAELQSILDTLPVLGERYGAASQALLNGGNLGAKVDLVFAGCMSVLFFMTYFHFPMLKGRIPADVDEMSKKTLTARQFSAYVCVVASEHVEKELVKQDVVAETIECVFGGLGLQTHAKQHIAEMLAFGLCVEPSAYN